MNKKLQCVNPVKRGEVQYNLWERLCFLVYVTLFVL